MIIKILGIQHLSFFSNTYINNTLCNSMNQTQKVWASVGLNVRKEIIHYLNYSDSVKKSLLEDDEIADLDRKDYAKIQRGIDQYLKNEAEN